MQLLATCNNRLPVSLTVWTDAYEFLTEEGGNICVTVHKDSNRVLQ